MIGNALAAIIVLASVGPHVVSIDEARFRVKIVFDDKSPTGHAKAQIALIQAAKKHCKGKGVAISEGALEVNAAEPLRTGRDALELGEVYRCMPKT